MNEFEFISKYLKPLAKSQASAGLEDDVAVMPQTDRSLIVTTDTIAQGRHFRVGDPWDTVGQKLVRVNVSDCFSKAALPRFALLNICWNREDGQAALEAFVSGLSADLEAFGIELIGGDTTSHEGPAVLGLTLFGECVREEGPLRRGDAAINQDVWVTGTIGDASLGLSRAKSVSPEAERLNQAYLVPSLPPIAFVDLLARFGHAALDVSDGLIADAQHLAKTSGLQVDLQLSSLPISDAARKECAEMDTEQLCLALASGGDDYQVLFTTDPVDRKAIEAMAAHSGLQVSRVGRTVEGEGVLLLGIDGEPVTSLTAGWEHSLFD